MAFCPNCGTPNTDQADKCVSCGFELSPKQKAKFKGTIMMSGVQAPVAPPAARPPEPAPAPQAAPVPQATPAPAPTTAGMGGKNLAFEKTMMGPMAAPPVMPAAAAPPPAQPPTDFSRAPTLEGQAPFLTPPVQSFQQPAEAAQPAFAAPPQMSAPAAPAQPMGGFGGGSTGDFGNTGGFGGGGGYGDSMAPPAGLPKKSNTGKILAIGCAALLVLSCVVGGLLFFVAKEKVAAIMGAAEKEGEALEWRGSVAQSLAQVSALCQTDCNGAAVYFHPEVQAALMGEAKQLTSERVGKLVDPTQSEARMLSATDDEAIAKNLNLDPAQCVRIVAGGAKVVGCSVPDPSGTASLRIVHLSGLGSL